MLELPMFPSPSMGLKFRNWTEADTAFAEALWCDSEVTRFFGGPMMREQAHARLQTECERDRSLGLQFQHAENAGDCRRARDRS